MAKKAKKVRSATPLSPEKVIETIKNLPAALRRYAEKSYKRFASGKAPKRLGSQLAAKRLIARGKGNLAMTSKDRKLAALMYASGASYRAVEEIQGMKPCSGNDAYRQISRAILEDRSAKLAKRVEKLCAKSGQPVPKACEAAVAIAATA